MAMGRLCYSIGGLMNDSLFLHKGVGLGEIIWCTFVRRTTGVRRSLEIHGQIPVHTLYVENIQSRIPGASPNPPALCRESHLLVSMAVVVSH